MKNIRTELRGQKCDVVLHDGSPNVGSNWLKDAYTQSELCLAALKCACEHLKPKGLLFDSVIYIV